MTKDKVVLVPFPFDDLSTAKARPAVCLTDPIGPHRHVVLAFITSRIPRDLLDTDLVLDSSHSDFAATGLRGDSVLRLHRLMTTSRVNLIHRPHMLTSSGTHRHSVHTRRANDRTAVLAEQLAQRRRPGRHRTTGTGWPWGSRDSPSGTDRPPPSR
jgi:mRNA interferase MazF